MTVGGFKDISTTALAGGEDAADIRAAAEAAIKELATREGTPLDLHKITSAAKQVVAGLNWKLVVEVVGAGGGGDTPAPRSVTATVYQPLGGAPLQVTSVE